ncbi:MAG: thiamine phosphate synthase, partial [Acidobacteria bacterium]|nr:thiamine phosphate synthase [Acidobacteriota bacterium]
PWAPQGLEQITQWRAQIACPLVAIGGITLKSVVSVLAANADSAAVITDIVTSEDPDRQTQNWLRATQPWRDLSTGLVKPGAA